MVIKIRTTDRLFSQYIRRRDKWQCQRCFKQYQEGDQGLQCSHFWGRAEEATRFEPLNCDSLCFGCHLYFHAHPGEYRDWKFKQLGKSQYSRLERQAHSYKKRDDKAVKAQIRLLLDNLNRVS